MRSVENGSVENAECGKWECRICGVWKIWSVENRSVENAECRKCGVWNMRSAENAKCGKRGV